MSEKNYTDVTTYELLPIVGIRRKERHYWNPNKESYDEKKHLLPLGSSVVIDVKVNLDGEDKWIEFPIYLGLGCNYEFYNSDKFVREWRKISLADVKDAWDRAMKCFPAWKEWAENYVQGDSLSSALKWFDDSSLFSSSVVNLAITTRTFDDGQVRKFVNICAQHEKKSICTDDEMAQINNALKAAGVKLFGKPKTASASPAAKAAPVPPTPPKVSVEKLREEAFADYQAANPDDTTGAGFYPKCAEIIGKDMNTWESWTAADWKQIKAAIDVPF